MASSLISLTDEESHVPARRDVQMDPGGHRGAEGHGRGRASQTIRRYDFGADAGISPGNYEFVVVADFDDVDGYLVYRDHPVHRKVIDDHISSIVAVRSAVQYRI